MLPRRVTLVPMSDVSDATALPVDCACAISEATEASSSSHPTLPVRLPWYERGWVRHLILASFLCVLSAGLLLAPQVLTEDWQWVPPFQAWLYAAAALSFLWILLTLVCVPVVKILRDLVGRLPFMVLRALARLVCVVVVVAGILFTSYMAIILFLLGIFSSTDYYGNSNVEIAYCSKTPGQICTATGGFPDFDNLEVFVLDVYSLASKHNHQLPPCRSLPAAERPDTAPEPLKAKPCSPGGAFSEESGD